MATTLLKKSYRISNFKEIPFRDLWGKHGVFTTMRIIGKPIKIIFFKEHIQNLIKSMKDYRIYKKELKLIIKKILNITLKKNIKYNHLLRLAITKDIISVSLRVRINPSKKFSINLYNYKRERPDYKNLKYNKILKKMNFINVKNCDLGLTQKGKILETATANILFVKNNILYSPKDHFYKGITIKYLNKMVNIKYTDIPLKNLYDYDEIILVGSGKGIVSLSKVEGHSWRRRSTKNYKILKNLYNKAVTKCPLYYS